MPTGTKLSIDVRELDVDAQIAPSNGTDQNLDTLQSSSAIIGRDWTANVLPRPNRTAAPTGFGLALIRIQKEGPPGVPILIDLAPLLFGFGSAPLSELLTTGASLRWRGRRTYRCRYTLTDALP